MQLVIVSGRSGSGKTVALGALEDLGYYCIDNLPLTLLLKLDTEIGNIHKKVAISIDARNISHNLLEFKNIINKLSTADKDAYTVIYLDANDNTILKRFGETRRKHPLTNNEISLREAIKKERKLLTPISNLATFTINTEQLSVHKLHHILKEKCLCKEQNTLQILVQSFGYKYGLPHDADFIFDVRCLPNPYWQPDLKDLTGKDQNVINFLQSEQLVLDMQENIYNFLDKIIPQFKHDNRSYLNFAIGCTGGQHRSVYLAQKIYTKLKDNNNFVLVRHRELAKYMTK